MFISPTEPERLRDIGVVSILPESFGADILFQSELGLVGVQRKEFPNDFLASVHDGRLNKQIAQMQDLNLGVLLLEGIERWTTDGKLIRQSYDKRNGWSRVQHRNYLVSVQLRGVVIAQADNLTDTIGYCNSLQVWCNKPNHDSLSIRGGVERDAWGNIGNREYAEYLIQGLPDIGPKLARAILDTIGLPFRLNVTEEELMTVPGISKGRARKIRRVFEQRQGSGSG